MLLGHQWWLALSCLSSLSLWYPFSWGPTVPAGELQPGPILQLQHEPSRCAVWAFGAPSYAVASHFLPCICRTGANATVKCLRAGCPSGGMLYRQTRQRLNVSPHSHPRHHRACTQPRSHRLLPPWTAWTKLVSLSEQTECCLPQRMHGVLAKLLLCLVPELLYLLDT